MDVLGLIKDVISMVLIGNALCGNTQAFEDENYMEVLEEILKAGNNNN